MRWTTWTSTVCKPIHSSKEELLGRLSVLNCRCLPDRGGVAFRYPPPLCVMMGGGPGFACYRRYSVIHVLPNRFPRYRKVLYML